MKQVNVTSKTFNKKCQTTKRIFVITTIENERLWQAPSKIHCNYFLDFFGTLQKRYTRITPQLMKNQKLYIWNNKPKQQDSLSRLGRWGTWCRRCLINRTLNI